MALPTRSSANALLVEGADDKAVCIAFVGRKADVIDAAGYETLRKEIPALLLARGRVALGIVVDADSDPAGRWQSLSHVLAAEGINLPEVPDPAGTVVETKGKPVVGVWLMPDNSNDGKLEDFIAFLVPKDDALMPYAQNLVDEVAGAIAEDDRFRNVDRPKAEVHAWLALQREPGKPFGQAITKKFLDRDCERAQAFANWLKRLFG